MVDLSIAMLVYQRVSGLLLQELAKYTNQVIPREEPHHRRQKLHAVTGLLANAGGLRGGICLECARLMKNMW